MMLGSAENENPKLIAVKLFSKYSNLPIRSSTSTSRTDRQTDGRTDRRLDMAIPRSVYRRAVKTEHRVHTSENRPWKFCYRLISVTAKSTGFKFYDTDKSLLNV